MKDIKEYFGKIVKNEKEMKILCGEESNDFNISEENNIFIMSKINEVFKKIEGKYKDVKVIEREIDNNSFKFLFHIEQDNQGEMFKTILKLLQKNTDVVMTLLNSLVFLLGLLVTLLLMMLLV
jgi:hypothetical protein